MRRKKLRLLTTLAGITIQSPIPGEGSAQRLNTAFRSPGDFAGGGRIARLFLPFPKITRLLVRLDHIARVIVNANHSIM
jgi:hypothetical protein